MDKMIEIFNEIRNMAEEDIVDEASVRTFKNLMNSAVEDSVKGIKDSPAWKQLGEYPMNCFIPPEACEYIRSHIDHMNELQNGKMNAMYLLFPGGSTEIAEKIYGDTAINRYMNNTVAEIVYRLCSEGKQRILEVGGGVGATTTPVMRKIRGLDFNYRFTDVSPFFLNSIKKKWPVLETGVLNLDEVSEADKQEKYDIIIAAGVLNAVKNITCSLDIVVNMLSENGVLLITEPTASHPEIDVSQGFIMQKYEDMRKNKGRWSLTEDEWIQLFSERGFKAVTYPDKNSPYKKLGYTVFTVYRGQETETVIDTGEI